VYPKIFDTYAIKSRGYLALSWAPGVLRNEKQVYPRGIQSLSTTTTGRDPVTWADTVIGVIKPLNLMNGYKLAWQVTQQDGYLEVSASLRHQIDNKTLSTIRPLTILENIAESLVLEACEHCSDTPLSSPDRFATYTGPMSPLRESYISCVAVDGDSGLRMLTLALTQLCDTELTNSPN
jgi:hypothetical protein